MDGSTSGLMVTTIGVGTVFSALLALTGAVSLLRRFSDSPEPAGAPEPAEPPPAKPSDAATEGAVEAPAQETGTSAGELMLVALAAYGLHRGHRVNPGSVPPVSGWAQAGRVRNTQWFER